MKVLVLSGEVTHQRPFTYGFPTDWQVCVLSLVDTEHLTICDKYGSPACVPTAEIISFLKRGYEKSIDYLRENEPDAIIGIGYGAHVLANLNSSHEWRGPSVFVLTEGNPSKYFFAQRPLSDELDYDPRPVKSAWIVSDDDATSRIGRSTKGRSSSLKKLSDFQGSDIFIRVSDVSALTLLFSSGIVASVVRCLR